MILPSSFALLRRLLLVLVLLPAMAGALFAQEEENRRLDNAKAALDAIEQQLSSGSFDDEALVAIQARIDGVRSDIAKVSEDLAPRAQTIQTRLDQLGPAPGEGAPPESPELAQERQAQIDAKKPIDETLRRASALSIQADQLSDNAARKRRDLFATRVLVRTRSILDPGLWGAVVNEAPRRFAAVSSLFGEWRDVFAERMHGRNGAILFGALAIAVLIAWPLRKWGQRMGQLYFAETAPATRLRRSAGALWVALIVTAAPSAAAVLVYYGLSVPGFVPDRVEPFVQMLLKLVVFAAGIAGLTRGILAPGRPSWRLPSIPDEAAVRLAPYPIWIATIFALSQALLSLLNVTGVGLSTVMTINGLAALAIAVVFALALRDGQEAEAEGGESEKPSETVEEYWLASVLRILAWGAVGVVIASAIIGYLAFSYFLARQILWVGVVGGILYILLALIDDLLTGWGPKSRIGRFAHSTVGLRNGRFEQLCVLASGILRLMLIAMAALLIIAPWGVQSGDVAGWVRRAFSGIAVAGFSFSPSALFVALALLGVGIATTRLIQNWLDRSYLPRTRLDDGLKNSIRTTTGYAGVLLAAGLAASSLGFGVERLALVAGALSVGIGFGLQSVVSNFVSGLILLAERPIKVGDWIAVGTDEGNVRDISVRSTQIELFDKSMLIVPNSDLITKPVRNRTLRNPLGVVKVTLGTGHEADVAEVRQILLDAVAEIPAILRKPVPEVLITGTTDLGVQWSLTCSVPTPRQVAAAKGELYFAVLKEFQSRNIRITA